MIIRQVLPQEKEKYNQVVDHPLQSWPWGEFRQKTGLKVIRLAEFEDKKLLRAYQLTLHPLPKTSFTIGYLPKGPQPDKNMLKNKVMEMKLENNVSFFPFTREPMYVFERIDILVLSSIYKEGLPNVLLEAMSMEVPVVSSKMAGVPEIIEDGKTGYMVEPGKSDQLAGAIIKLWSDPIAYKKIRKSGRELMETNFDKDIQFTKFLEYFHQITEK